VPYLAVMDTDLTKPAQKPEVWGDRAVDVEIEKLLVQRRALRKEMLYCVGHEKYLAAKAKVETLDAIIPWVHYKVTGANVEQRRDGGHFEFQSLDGNLDKKPLSEWTENELERIPYYIEDIDIAIVSKVGGTKA